MKRVPAVLVAAGLFLTAACQASGESALGQRPTAYPAVGDSPVAQSGLTARHALIAAAEGATEAVLGYDHRTLDRDAAQTRNLMTPAFRRSYDNFIDRLRVTAEKQHARASAIVVDAAIIGSTATRASVLVFIDQSLSTSTGRRETDSSAVLTLESRRGRWLLASLETSAPRHPVVDERPTARAALAAAAAVADAYADLSWEHPTADIERVLSLSSGAFRSAYNAAAPELIRRTTQSRTTQQGSVIAAGLNALRGDRAQVLVGVSGSTQIGDGQPHSHAVRLVVTLERRDGTWLATALRVVPAPEG
jgi:Mce-associated membrane protein